MSIAVPTAYVTPECRVHIPQKASFIPLYVCARQSPGPARTWCNSGVALAWYYSNHSAAVEKNNRRDRTTKMALFALALAAAAPPKHNVLFIAVDDMRPSIGAPALCTPSSPDLSQQLDFDTHR